MRIIKNSISYVTIILSILLVFPVVSLGLNVEPAYSQTPGFETVILFPQQDSFLSDGNGNVNEGANDILRLKGKQRPIIQFDQSLLEQVTSEKILENATLRFFVTSNTGNWGPSGDIVNIHRVLQIWEEGNGSKTGLVISGFGSGTTWNCAIDSDISNTQSDCPFQWDGGNFTSFVTDNTIIDSQTNDMFVEFNVTSDVQGFLNGTYENNGWLMRKTNDDQSGKADFASKENTQNSPELLLVFQNPTITWETPELNVEPRQGLSLDANFTSDLTFANTEVLFSNEIKDLVSTPQSFISVNSTSLNHTLPLNFQFLPNATSGWHNGTVIFSQNNNTYNDPLSLNILIPQIGLDEIQTPSGNFTRMVTPSDSAFFNDTFDVSIFLTLENGTAILTNVYYDLYGETNSTSSATMSIENTIQPITTGLSVTNSSCTDYAMTYHFEQFAPSVFDGDIEIASDVLNTDENNPLIIRNDLKWWKVDNGHFENGLWIHNFNNSAIDEYFTFIPDGSKSYVILGVQQPPGEIGKQAPLVGGRTGGHYLNSDAANGFVNHVVTYIKNNSTLYDKVSYWQIDNEPNVQLPNKKIKLVNPAKIKIFADWSTVADGLAQWSTTIKGIDPDKPLVINFAQTSDDVGPFAAIGNFLFFSHEPLRNLMEANPTSAQTVLDNVDIVGYDIYADQWTAFPITVVQGFDGALDNVEDQVGLASSNFGFDGRWGLTESPAGPKDSFGSFFFIMQEVTDQDVASQLDIVRNRQIEGKGPAIIAPFQLRAPNTGLNAQSLPFDDAYGLITDASGGGLNDGTNGTMDFFSAIKNNVVPTCGQPESVFFENFDSGFNGWALTSCILQNGDQSCESGIATTPTPVPSPPNWGFVGINDILGTGSCTAPISVDFSKNFTVNQPGDYFVSSWLAGRDCDICTIGAHMYIDDSLKLSTTSITPVFQNVTVPLASGSHEITLQLTNNISCHGFWKAHFDDITIAPGSSQSLLLESFDTNISPPPFDFETNSTLP